MVALGLGGASISSILQGVLVGIDGPFSNVIKICPPLVFDENQALQLIDALDRCLGDI